MVRSHVTAGHGSTNGVLTHKQQFQERGRDACDMGHFFSRQPNHASSHLSQTPHYIGDACEPTDPAVPFSLPPGGGTVMRLLTFFPIDAPKDNVNQWIPIYRFLTISTTLTLFVLTPRGKVWAIPYFTLLNAPISIRLRRWWIVMYRNKGGVVVIITCTCPSTSAIAVCFYRPPWRCSLNRHRCHHRIASSAMREGIRRKLQGISVLWLTILLPVLLYAWSKLFWINRLNWLNWLSIWAKRNKTRGVKIRVVESWWRVHSA